MQPVGRGRADYESTVYWPHHKLRSFRSAKVWIALSVIAPLGMLTASAFMLFDLRQDAWERSEQTSKNLLQVLERDIARNIEMYDLSIQAAADNLKTPGVAEIDPQLRQLILFDRAATARDMGVMLVIDERGDIVADLDAIPRARATMRIESTSRSTKLARASVSTSDAPSRHA